MLHGVRHAIGLVLAASAALAGTGATVSLGTPVASAASVHPEANGLWTSCNDTAGTSAPKVLWTRIHQATATHHDIPASFWSDPVFREDIVKIICYESTYDFHASAVGGQYGWYQMSQSLIASQGVTWSEYWTGTPAAAAGWYQCVAGERYIKNRYGTPAAAWQHERDYGWY
ncbi:MAG: hypothetical protein ACYCSF_12655 [Acidimicrobiales bacterium]